MALSANSFPNCLMISVVRLTNSDSSFVKSSLHFPIISASLFSSYNQVSNSINELILNNRIKKYMITTSPTTAPISGSWLSSLEESSGLDILLLCCVGLSV